MKFEKMPDLSFFSIIFLADTHGFLDDFELQRKIIDEFEPDYVLYEFLEDNKLISSKDFDDFLKKGKVSDMTDIEEVKDLVLLCKKKKISLIGIDFKNFGIENPKKFKSKLEKGEDFSKKEMINIDRINIHREINQFEKVRRYVDKGKILVITGSYHLREGSLFSSGFRDSLIIYPRFDGKMLIEPVVDKEEVVFSSRKSSKLKLRKSTYILDAKDSYVVIYTNTRVIRKFKVSILTKKIIELLLGELYFSDLVEKLPDFKIDEIVEILNGLRKYNIVYDDVKLDFDDVYIERFDRQLTFLGEIADSQEDLYNMQNKIKNSVVTVFGVGGIGSWIVNGLSQIDVGEIRIVDPDTVDMSNLNRQLFFTSKDVGKYKVDVIKEKLLDANIKVYKKFVSEKEDLSEIFEGCDFVINCADSPSVHETTRVISKYCVNKKISYSVAGGYNMHLGMLGPIIVPGDTACFDCFLKYQKENSEFAGMEKIKDIEQTGSISPIAGVIANFHVMDVFKFLIGKGSINKNKFAEIDFMNLDINWRFFDKQDCCKN